MAKLEIDINKLSPEERLDLIEELWDSLSVDPANIPLARVQAERACRPPRGMRKLQVDSEPPALP
jgi:hypothetical protein